MWYNLIAYASWGTSFLPLCYFLVSRGFRLSVLMNYVLLLTCLSFTVDGLCLLLNQFDVSNSYLINLYASVELLILLRIYYLFFEREKWRWVFKLLAMAFILFVTYVLVFAGNFSSFSNQLSTVTAIIAIIFSILAFNRLVGQNQEVTTNYFFWINGAFMVYYLCNLALFLFMAYILADDTGNIWAAHNFFHICSNFMILTGFVLWRKQNSSSTSLSGS